jgi:hypothetical protein
VIEDEITRRLHVEVLLSVLRSVTRIRLVKTENRSACATEHYIL